MASSNVRIKKVCEYCGEIFEAQKVSTRFCSHRCANRAYKKAERNKRVEQEEVKTAASLSSKPLEDIKYQEYLSFREAGILLGLTRQAIYKMVKAGYLNASKISSRLSIIKRSDIDKMLDSKPYQKATLNNKQSSSTPITDFYTTAEIKEKYKVADSWIFVVAKKYNIPKTFNRGKTYWSKKHIDRYFSAKAPSSEITEWYTVEEIQEKFEMTLAAIYTFVNRNPIPKKKESGRTFYSQKHFDIAKGIIKAEEPQYYMVAEAMEKFNLTRDQLYHYVKYHKIPKVKFGKYTKISKPELDKLFEAPKID